MSRSIRIKLSDEHEAYCKLLRRYGVTVVTLPASASYPDCGLVEDVAIVVDELAIITLAN